MDEGVPLQGMTEGQPKGRTDQSDLRGVEAIKLRLEGVDGERGRKRGVSSERKAMSGVKGE